MKKHKGLEDGFNLLPVIVGIIILLIIVMLWSNREAHAGVGGWNEYKGVSYKYEELDELRAKLLEDGYIQLTPENDYMGLTTDPDYQRYTTLPNDEVEGYVHKRDLDNYLNTTGKEHLKARDVMWENQVEIHTYGYKPFEVTPVPKGTLFIKIYAAEEYQDHDLVVLFSDQNAEPYAVTVHPYNNFEFTGNVPIGHYTFVSLLLDGNMYNSVDASLRDVFREQGMDVYEMSATSINIGAGIDLSSISGITDITNREIEVAATPTPVPSVTPTPQPTEEPAVDEVEDVTSGNRSILQRIATVLLPVVMLGLGAAIARITYLYLKRKGEDEPF